MTVNKGRCTWADGDPLYQDYHDKEWGIPIYDDRKIFEFLTLETFQAGLSWITVLRKRNNFRKAFDDFNFIKIAEYDEKKCAELLGDSGIIRNKLKIKSAITNAQKFIAVREEYGTFSKYIWGFVGNKPIQNLFKSLKDIPASTELSDRISKDLKRRGFKFVGSIIIYAHMQASGMVNDHFTTCFRHKEVQGL
jgi:DNA-3-methyladenine glycosylase I